MASTITTIERNLKMGYSIPTHAVISYIEAHLKDGQIDHEALEQSVGFSYAHIRDFFRRNTGYSLAHYVRMRKICVSAFDLLHSEQPVLEVALHYGFSCHESYSRAFKKITGSTPSAFRKARPLMGKEELITGVYGIRFLNQKERRSDVKMNTEKYRDNDSTVLYGVPEVTWGTYGGNTPLPMCLKACADYLGEDIEYAFFMASCGAAFRLTWNEEDWDLGNVDIYHTFRESNDVYRLGVEALGREYDVLERNNETTKEEFIQFIRRHVDEGYPCIATGIIGPPEPCIITGYRDNGNTLLGWNFFQKDPAFAEGVQTDDSGYFICDNWWENTDTQLVMCMGPVVGEKLSAREIVKNAVLVLTGRKEGNYCKGIAAFDAWKEMLSEESWFHVGNNYSLLFEKMLCLNDAMGCLFDGSGSAAAYFKGLAEQEAAAGTEETAGKYRKLEALFSEIKETICRMQDLFGDYRDIDGRLPYLADAAVRKNACTCIEEVKQREEEALRLMKEL